jgi:hypothetical protein
MNILIKGDVSLRLSRLMGGRSHEFGIFLPEKTSGEVTIVRGAEQPPENNFDVWEDVDSIIASIPVRGRMLLVKKEVVELNCYDLEEEFNDGDFTIVELTEKVVIEE